MDCLFCKIVNKEIPSEIIHEDEEIIAFKDIQPVAPVHLLIIPKRHIISINHVGPGDCELVGKLFVAAKELAKEHGVFDSGYRLIFNIGKDSGQTVDHLHLHLIGGEKLPWA